MKNLYIRQLILLFCVMVLGTMATLAQAQSTPAKGYRLTVELNAYQGQTLYLAYHFGKIKALADSTTVQADGKAVFSGPNPLTGGIYIVVSPRKEFLFEMLVDKEQSFTVRADTGKLSQVRFTGSTDNTDFQSYTAFVQSRGAAISQLQQQLKEQKTPSDSASIQQQMNSLNGEIQQFRTDFIRKNPDAFLSTLFAALQEPVVPPAAQHPKGVYDQNYAYHYFKDRYWDGINLYDDRLLRTPFFESRVEKYFRNLVSPEADSIKKEIDWFLLMSRSNRETYKFLLTHFVQKYINPEYMGQDAVFVHLFEKYINEKPDVDWFTAQYKKYMTDRAYSLMANLIGNPAWDLNMTDSNGKLSPLYEVKASYTVVCFWDPTCGHCKEMVPKLDSIYQAKWKKQGIKIYGVMTEGGKEAWLKFIRENNLKDWVHVYQTEKQRTAEQQSGKPGYRQLYDVYQTPVIYLLDDQKRIIAKKLTYDQMDQLITVKQQQKPPVNR